MRNLFHSVEPAASSFSMVGAFGMDPTLSVWFGRFASQMIEFRIDEDAARFPVFFIRPRCTAPSIGRGTLHKLADAGRVAWHPDAADAVRRLGAGGGAP